MGVRRIWLTVATESCVATNYLDIFVSNSPIYCNMAMGDLEDASHQVFTDRESFVEVGGRLMVRPNPFAERLLVDMMEETTAEGVLQLMDMNGCIWLEVELGLGVRELELNTAALPSGVYLLVYRSVSGDVRRVRVFKP